MKKKGKKSIVSLTLVALFLLGDSLIFVGESRSERSGDPSLGRTVYLKSCAHCHGKRGEGLGPRASLPNFSDPKYMVGKNDRDLFDKITRGGQGSGMPSFERSLDEKTRWDVIAYLRTLSSP